nr:MAG TPA: hypothetical protein [Caudoviricetes sp.]
MSSCKIAIKGKPNLFGRAIVLFSIVQNPTNILEKW